MKKLVFVASLMATACSNSHHTSGPRQPLSISLTADVTLGSAPLVVTFQTSVTGPTDVEILSYDWDFSDNGSVDLKTTDPTASFTYNVDGPYTAAVKISTRQDGEAQATLDVVVHTPGAPSVNLSATPTRGAAPLLVTLNAAVTDPNDSVITAYAWDFDDDGTVDLSGTDAQSQTTYSALGNIRARVEVTDAQGAKASATTTIIVPGLRDAMYTIAGSGNQATDACDANADGMVDAPIAALTANFDLPLGALATPDGRLLLLDWNGHKIRSLDFNTQEIAFVVGTGVEGDACEAPEVDGSCRPLAAELNHMTNLIFDDMGRLLISAWHNSKVKRVDFGADRIVDVCGAGDRKYRGDGNTCFDASNVAQVSFDLPSKLARDATGNIFILDQSNQVIRRIGTDGIVTTVAGNCPILAVFGCPDGQGYDGDGGPATSAHLRFDFAQGTDPQGGLAFDSLGNLYIADTQNHVVRRVGPGSDGVIGSGDPTEEIITTYAGIGTPGNSGDGGPATLAALYGPRDLAMGADDTLYIADTFNNCIRAVTPEGAMTTVAGQCGTPGGFDGEGGPATSATLYHPFGVTLDAAGNIYVADTVNNRFRVVYRF